MSINACANAAVSACPQPLNASCNPNSPEAIVKKLFESLQPKPSCSGGSPSAACGGSAPTGCGSEDEKTKLLKLLLARMGEPTRSACGTPQQASPCGTQPCAA